MAAGFIIVRRDADGEIDGYWDGTEFINATEVDAIDSSDFVETVTDARFVQGSIQAANTDADVDKVAAESNITLVP